MGPVGGRALALIGGLALLVNPGAGLRLVKWTLGLFLLGWGVMRLVRLHRPPGPDLAGPVGPVHLGAGIGVVLAWPGVTVTALLYILVVGGLCLASVDLVGAFVDRRRHPSWWLQLLHDLGTLALVVALLVWPGRPSGRRDSRGRTAPAFPSAKSLPVAHPRRPPGLPRPARQGDPAPAHLSREAGPGRRRG